MFLNILELFRNKKCHILEVGTYVGTSVINMLKYLDDATAMVIDRWENYDEDEFLSNIIKNNVEKIFYQNLKMSNMENRITAIKGDSKDILQNLEKNQFDFIYVDGDHTYNGCYTDLVLSWDLLKENGILAIDDYLWKKNESDNPHNAVNHFMDKYKDKIIVLDIEYRIFLQKSLDPLIRTTSS